MKDFPVERQGFGQAIAVLRHEGRLLDKVQQALEDLIVEGKARGLIGECDTKAAIMALMSAINILPRWFNEKGKLSPETLAESYSHVFTYGLAAR